jgi:beta-aspartyl-dipeptidase (metallo-type)
VGLQVITTTPAAYLQLGAKGRIRVGGDADLVLLDRNLEVDGVLARGEVLLRDHRLERLGAFERDAAETLFRKQKAYGHG